MTEPDRRCIATHNPGRWPYVARCMNHRKHKGMHEDQYGNRWPQERIVMPAGNGLSVYVIGSGEFGEGFTPVAVAYTWSTAKAVMAQAARTRGLTLGVIAVRESDLWEAHVEENQTDMFEVRRFTVLNRVDEFTP